MWLHATESTCIKLQTQKLYLIGKCLKPTGLNGHKTPLIVQDIIEMNEDERESTE